MSASAQAAGGSGVAPFRVGLLGHGTVGSAFVRLLDERADEIERFNDRRPVISGVLTRTRGNFEEILSDADLLVELMGGIEPAREFLLAAMQAGKDVVSANKLLLSQYGEELFETARQHDVRLRFEAAVAGVVPVVRVLEESLSATPIERIHGIVNGTTNFILTEMTAGATYAEALADAQRRGFAEADPSDDVSGRDAAAKMAILARLAFGRPVHLDEVDYEGIEHLHGDDLEYARDLGLGLKLIGTAERREGGLSVRVHPAFLYAGHPLASVVGPFNAVTVEAEAITEITLSGRRAEGRRRVRVRARRAAHDPRDRRGVGVTELRPRLPTVESAAPTGTHVPLIDRYREHLPFAAGDPLVSLQEGSTPLLRAPVLSELVGATVRLKLEGA